MSAVSLINAKRAPKGVCIGLRWTPAHVQRVDNERGTYECVNSPLHELAESLVQRALLAKPSPSLLRRLFGSDSDERIEP